MDHLINLLFTFWAVACICAGRETSEEVSDEISGEVFPRISHGFTASKGQFPYEASIYYHDHFICGASVIHKRWVLTAARCKPAKYVKDAYVKVGTNYRNGIDGQKISIDEFIRHEEYNIDATVKGALFDASNDIALIRLSNDIQFNDNLVKPIILAKDDTNKYENVTATLSGLRCTEDKVPNEPEEMQYLQVKVISDAVCEHVWGDWKLTIFRHFICTSVIKKSSACKGAPGGPLVFEEKQIGIVSTRHAYPYGDDLIPNVHTRVSYFIPWISRQLELYSDTL